MKNGSDTTRPEQMNLYSTRCSLDKIQDLTIMRRGDRPTIKSKKDKVQKYNSLFFWKQPVSNWLKSIRTHSAHFRNANSYVMQLRLAVVSNMLDDN